MAEQEFYSAATSINRYKVPALFKKVPWIAGTKNLDWGGGRFDTATDYLKLQGVTNFIYDPYNRSPEHNAKIGDAETYQTATLSNVLCVIKEQKIRQEIVKKVLTFLQPGGIIYIKIYEGNKSGIGRQTLDGCWQNNMRTSAYLAELREFNPTIKNNIITIIKEDK